MFQAAQPNPATPCALLISSECHFDRHDRPDHSRNGHARRESRARKRIHRSDPDGVGHEDERQKFLAGLEEVDKRSNVLFTKDFADAAPAQQDALLSELDLHLSVEREYLAHRAYVRRPHTNQLEGVFLKL